MPAPAYQLAGIFEMLLEANTLQLLSNEVLVSASEQGQVSTPANNVINVRFPAFAEGTIRRFSANVCEELRRTEDSLKSVSQSGSES